MTIESISETSRAPKPQLTEIALADVLFDEVIYPRHAHDPALVQRYADCLDEIEAQQKYISVSADMKLLDGKHRWLAYKKRDQAKTIRAFVYPITAPHDQLKLAAELNSAHGWQLTEADKEETAKSLYAYGYSYDTIAAALSVGKKKVAAWLANIAKANKDKRDRKIFDLWMACYTQEEIAEACECDQATVKRISDDFMQIVPGNQMHKTAANHLTDFDPPLYNIWTQAAKSNAVSHFGNTEQRWLDNLLYLYTEPFDVVVDPFAGGGSTIDVCRKRYRRYWASDRKPIVERETEIRCHDITAGLPALPRWKDVRLIYLDPPYWRQAEHRYSTDPEDLANMDLDRFHATLVKLIHDFAKKLKASNSTSHIALILQPTQWKAPNREFTDHIAEMLRAVRLPIDMRFSAPYSTEQCTPQMVEWAKANKRCLVLTRELVVWRCV